ncbi:MAG: aminoglycoside phosphotransferase family protein [Victivallales bacterium]|nr:aminoglycoside phosphotransferase family protein [Victivallales bacterium]
MKAAMMAQRFNVDGWLVSAYPMGDGNVNDTYQCIFRTVFSEEKIVLQRLNSNVFKDPEAVMANMHLVTNHAHKRLIEEHDIADRIWQLPRIIPAKDGRDYAIDGDGGFWRAITRIASAHSYETIQSAEHAREVGAVLGNFHHLMSDMDASKLKDTLPGFHITPGYFQKFDEALATPEGQARLNSSQISKNVYRYIQERREWSSVLEDAKARGEIQDRVIHGDPKTANVMIDDTTAKGTAIIDLDTTKPGLVHYDIGDCLRSCCNPVGEDCQDLSQVVFDLDLCEAVLKGYQAHSQNFMTDAEKNYLYDCVRLITFELCLRFYADFLAGDVYFKITRDGQNLHRARVQMQLCMSIEARESQIRRTLERM